MDLASADEVHDVVARLLYLETAANGVAVVARHVDRALVAEEIRRVQHVDVEYVAFDPFAAIKQPAKLAQRPADGNAERVLHRVDGAHLIGDRADAADARHEVGRLGEGAAAQERLEEARRLEDRELRRFYLAVAHDDLERAFAFDAREIVDLDRLTCHGAPAPRGTPGRSR